MKIYYKKHKQLARQLRNAPTEAEKKLWQHIKGKQINRYQFFRQRMLGKYIVDFYCPALKLVIELDGGQHFEEENIKNDEQREKYLNYNGLKVLRFNNNQVLQEINVVLEYLYEITRSR